MSIFVPVIEVSNYTYSLGIRSPNREESPAFLDVRSQFFIEAEMPALIEKVEVLTADQTDTFNFIGYGLVGLRERVDQLGGSIQSGPGKNGGFEVEVSIPLQEVTNDPGSAG